MKRWRQRERFHGATASIGRSKQQPVEETNFSISAYAAVEIIEVGATTQSHVLAVVHVLASGQHVGRGPATQMGPFFEQTYAVAGFSQRDGRGESRQAAADHDHVFQGHYSD